MPRRKSCPLVLLTDFGAHSAYVGQMKLVVASQAPGVSVIDLAHDLPPQDLSAATLVLRGTARFLPPKAVLCAVIDPGVGSARRILVARFSSGVQAVIPDNGLLGALQGLGELCELREATNKRWMRPDISPVFHGRDVFAPVAARLAVGKAIKKVGPRVKIDSCVTLPWPEPVLSGGQIKNVRIVYADRFGNLVTNWPSEALEGTRQKRGKKAPVKTHSVAPSIRFGGKTWPWATHYAQQQPGARLALAGSFGFVELAVRDGSALKSVDGRTSGEVRVRIASSG